MDEDPTSPNDFTQEPVNYIHSLCYNYLTQDNFYKPTCTPDSTQSNNNNHSPQLQFQTGSQDQLKDRNDSKPTAIDAVHVMDNPEKSIVLRCSEPLKDVPNKLVGSSSNPSIPRRLATFTDGPSQSRETSVNPSIPECLNTHTDGSSEFNSIQDNHDTTELQSTNRNTSKQSRNKIEGKCRKMWPIPHQDTSNYENKECGQMCPNPHLSTSNHEKEECGQMCPNPHICPCVQIHIQSTSSTRKKNVDKMCPNPHFSHHWRERRMWTEVSKSTSGHIELCKQRMWTNVSKSTSVHIGYVNKECGQKCPNPLQATLSNETKNVDRSVQIHFRPH